MKRVTKLISIILVLVMCFTLCSPQVFAAELTSEVTDPGGTAETPVVLNVAPATFSVTIPTGLHIDVDGAGNVEAATEAKIINNSHGPVKVVDMTITAADGWTIANYDLDLRNEKVDSNQISMVINNCQTTGANAIAFNAANFNTMLAKNDADSDECAIIYSAKVTPLSEAFANGTVANVVFTIDWDKVISRISIPVSATNSEGTDLNATASAIVGSEQTDLLDKLEQSGLIDSADEVDALIEVESDDFDDFATTTFNVSEIAQEGDSVVILHFNEETQEWEYVSEETVDADGKVTADFSSYSPVAFVVVKSDGSTELIGVSVYYNQPYNIAFGSDTLSLVFFEDDTCMMYENGIPVASENVQVVWGEGCVTIDGTEHSISEDKTQIEVADGMYVTLNVIKHGLYREEPYTLTVDGDAASMTMYEDGSVDFSIGGYVETIPKDVFVLENYCFIDVETGETIAYLSFDGTQIVWPGMGILTYTPMKELNDENATSFTYNCNDAIGYYSVTSGDVTLIRISAAHPTADQIPGATFTIMNDDTGETIGSAVLTESDLLAISETLYAITEMCFVALIDNTTFEIDGTAVLTFPKAGVYFMRDAAVENFGTTNLTVTLDWGKPSVFFERLYSATNDSGDKLSYVFYEDGAVRYYENNMLIETLSAGSAIYSETTFTINDTTVETSDDKTQFVINDLTYVLEDEGSVYYESKYSAIVGSDKQSYVFYEDETVEYYVNNVLKETLSADTVIYGNDLIVIDDTYGIISDDKTSIVINNTVYELEPVLAAKSTWYKGTVTKSTITTINIVDSYTPDDTELESWDADTYGLGLCKAYILADGETLVLSGNGSGYVVANEDSSYAFSGFTSATSINGLDLLDTSNVTNMSGMFYNCYSLTELNVVGFDTGNTTNMNNMFYCCKSLTKLDISELDTSNVINMSNMFYCCLSINQLDISSFDTANVTNMSSMFASCNDLLVIYASDKWDVTNVANSGPMFSGCHNLVGGAGTVYNDNYQDSTYAHIDGGASKPGYFTDVTDKSNSVLSPSSAWYRTSTDKSTITTINIVDSYTPVGTELESWNADFADLGKYKGYILSDGVTLVLAGDGTGPVSANVNSKSMFSGFTKVASIDGLNLLDTSNVIIMSSMFANCKSLAELDVTDFDTSNATRMDSMFSGCAALTTLDVTNWQTGNVTSMSSMFAGTGVTTLDVGNFDTRNVTDMSGMFKACDFTEINLNNFDTYNVTDMSSMFKNCNELLTLDVSNFDTSNVTDMSSMFSGCYSVSSLNMSGFDSSTVTNMSYMFNFCSSLTTLDVSNFNTGNVKDMSYMFAGCSSLTTLDASAWKTGNVENMSNMFDMSSRASIVDYSTSLVELNLNNWDTSNVTNMNRMFSYCHQLTELDVTHFNTSNVTDMGDMFWYCYNLAELDVTRFDTANVTDMSGMFSGCYDLAELDVTNFNTANVTDMSSMFSDCRALTKLDVTRFNTAKITDMSSMFKLCKKLVALDLTNFNTSNVTNMNNMFADCDTLTELDISSFDTSKIVGVGMGAMFYGCGNLKTIYVSDKWSVAEGLSASAMFYLCMSIVGGEGTTYDHDHQDIAYAHIDGGTSNPGYFTDIADKVE